MRVNVYAEEMTDKVEIISKEIEGSTFTGLRFYLELPTTLPKDVHLAGSTIAVQDAQFPKGGEDQPQSVQGPFLHRAGDDDSAAVTFWGKRDLRKVLQKALHMLDAHYGIALAGSAHFGPSDFGRDREGAGQENLSPGYRAIAEQQERLSTMMLDLQKNIAAAASTMMLDLQKNIAAAAKKSADGATDPTKPTVRGARSYIYFAISMERARQEGLKKAGKFSWTCADTEVRDPITPENGLHFHDARTVLPAEKLAVLLEEVGEVGREVVEDTVRRDRGGDAGQDKRAAREAHRVRLRAELIQTAAVCVAWIESLDHDTQTEEIPPGSDGT